MANYIKKVEIPRNELESLNKMLSSTEPMSLEQLNDIRDSCVVSWHYQIIADNIDYFDRFITAEFDNDMIMDIWFFRGVGDMKGTYGGIQFGDSGTVFINCGEYSEVCYPILEEGTRDKVDGKYHVFYNGDVYTMEVVAKD